MALFGRGELGLLGGGEGLRDDVGGARISCSPSPLPGDIYPASGLALAAAYHDIKMRLASLERENSSIKRKLKNYEVKFPVICDFGEEKIPCYRCCLKPTCSFKANILFLQLQKSKEREERLEDVIQAYEKIHLEKSNVQRDLDKMELHCVIDKNLV
uniref:TBK1 binding protein 1 n=1 Tax=Sphaeramia orbicularis TaxID=375764 RepID=A0A673ALV3_9TELE